MAIRIITDSAADIADPYLDRIIQVPTTVSFGEEEYLDGVTLDKDTFYHKLEDCTEFPKTSQPSPAFFESAFKKVQDQGDEALVITQTSRLSGTYQTACIVAEEFPGIQVLDSCNASVGAGVLAEYAMACVEKGMNLARLTEHLNKKKEEIGVYARMDTLKYAVKGGRVSKTAALAGNILNIKPLITIKNGLVAITGKARGRKKANKLLMDKVKESGIDFSMPMLLGYTGIDDESLQEFIQMAASLWEGHFHKPDATRLCTGIGAHMGPGAVAIAYFKSKI